MKQHGPAGGFTLIELLIALVVVGILTAIALPAFTDSMRKSHRSEAFAGISAIQQAEERWRGIRPQYTATIGDLNALGINTRTPSGYYDLELASSTVSGDTLATAYVATARAVAGSAQASDGQCRNLSVRVRGGNVEYAACESCASFSYAPTNVCWNR